MRIRQGTPKGEGYMPVRMNRANIGGYAGHFESRFQRSLRSFGLIKGIGRNLPYSTDPEFRNHVKTSSTYWVSLSPPIVLLGQKSR